MGIKNLNRFLKNKCPSVYQTVNLSSFAHKKVAIDVSLFLYKYKSCSPDRWLRSFVALFATLRSHDVHCIVVFDTGCPAEKGPERAERTAQKERCRKRMQVLQTIVDEYMAYINPPPADGLKNAIENDNENEETDANDENDNEEKSEILNLTLKNANAIENEPTVENETATENEQDAVCFGDSTGDRVGDAGAGNKFPSVVSRAFVPAPQLSHPGGISSAREQLRKMKMQDIRVSPADFEMLRGLLDVLFVPYTYAPLEAETACSDLCMRGCVDAVLSEDTDVFAYGTPVIICKIDVSSSNVVRVDIADVMSRLSMTPEMFLDFCILCGTDYNHTIPGFTADIAYELVREFKSIDSIAESLSVNTDKLNHVRVREIFKGFERSALVFVPYCGVPDSDRVDAFLRANDSEKGGSGALGPERSFFPRGNAYFHNHNVSKKEIANDSPAASVTDDKKKSENTEKPWSVFRHRPRRWQYNSPHDYSFPTLSAGSCGSSGSSAAVFAEKAGAPIAWSWTTAAGREVEDFFS